MCIDIFILLLASFLTFFIVSNLTNKFNEAYPIEFRYGLIICINLIFFFIFRTYAGIIRFTTFVDAIRILVATFLSFLTLVVINFASYALYGSKIYLLPTLIIYFITSFVLLFLFRVAVKFTFDNYLSKSKEKNIQKVVILGTSQNAVALANSLNIQNPQKYKLVGFVDISKAKNHNKDLLGIPIFKVKNSIPPLLRVLKAEAIILLNEDISNEEKLKIVEECLRFDYKILTVPELNDWSNKKHLSKRIKKFEIKDLLERLPIELDNKNIEIQIKDKVLLVTGAAGSIGSEIVTQVLKYKPAKLVLVDQAETPLHNIVLELAKKASDTEIISLIADIRDELLLHHIFTTYKPNVVYHAAAYKHVPLMEENPYQAIMTNVKGTKCLADLALQHNVERFVMVSTDKAVNPSNIMGASKRIAEIYVQSLFFKGNASNEQTTKFITTRFGNVLGSNGSVVPLFTKQIEEGGPITITHPDIIRYFMTIPEACQLVLEAGAMGNGGEIYIFDMGKPVKIIDLARKMIQLAGYVPEVEIPIKIVGLRPGEKLYEELLNDSAKTLPTHHQKIMIATEQSNYSNKEIQDLLEELLQTSKQFKINEAVGIMKRIVPEFVSKNSEFEILDN
ncbi:MAG: nucleoside-diphosphate sugar epimerase/dehydratase [Flavobacterium sp.]